MRYLDNQTFSKNLSYTNEKEIFSENQIFSLPIEVTLKRITSGETLQRAVLLQYISDSIFLACKTSRLQGNPSLLQV